MTKTTYTFARNTTREYFDIEAASEADARAILTGGQEHLYYSGSRSMDEYESPFELIDIEESESCQHNYQRLPGHSLGCVTYRCTHCGDEYEKDIS